MTINDINEYLNEEYENQGFHTQKLTKNIYLYLTGDKNYKIENWIAEYGHLLSGWNDIKNLIEKTQITYVEIDEFTSKNKKII